MISPSRPTSSLRGNSEALATSMRSMSIGWMRSLAASMLSRLAAMVLPLESGTGSAATSKWETVRFAASRNSLISAVTTSRCSCSCRRNSSWVTSSTASPIIWARSARGIPNNFSGSTFLAISACARSMTVSMTSSRGGVAPGAGASGDGPPGGVSSVGCGTSGGACREDASLGPASGCTSARGEGGAGVSPAPRRAERSSLRETTPVLWRRPNIMHSVSESAARREPLWVHPRRRKVRC